MSLSDLVLSTLMGITLVLLRVSVSDDRIEWTQSKPLFLGLELGLGIPFISFTSPAKACAGVPRMASSPVVMTFGRDTALLHRSSFVRSAFPFDTSHFFSLVSLNFGINIDVDGSTLKLRISFSFFSTLCQNHPHTMFV